MNKKYYLSLWNIVSLIVLCSCNGGNSTSSSSELQEYPVIRLEGQSVNLYNTYPATIRGAVDTEIRSRVVGIIKEVYVDEGIAVKAGQALFKIDAPSAEMTLRSAAANVSRMKAAVSTAEIDVERYRPLASEGIVSDTRLRTYENAYQTALAALEQAEAELKNAQEVIGWTTVTSPIDGVVGAINYRTGALVDASDVLTSVSATNDVYGYFSVNEKVLYEFLDSEEDETQTEKMKRLPPIKLILASGKEYPETGTVETITGTVDIMTGTAIIRVRFPNRNGILRSGMSGNVVIPSREENTLLIPQAATFSIQDKTIAYKVQGDSVVQQNIEVKPTPDGKQYIVIEGLRSGDRIVTDDIYSLSNGQRIRIRE